MTKVRRVALYARFSTDMQNPKSVDDQFAECRRYAERNSYLVVKEFSDRSMSGALRDRPGFIELLAAVEARNFDIVLFEHIDRLGRDMELVSKFYKVATHADTEIHQLSKGKLGLLDIGIMSTMAAMYLEDIAYKTRRGLRGKFAAGKSAGGLSYGYSLRLDENGAPIKGDIDIAENEAAVVRRIFNEYAAGLSPLKIASGLNSEGIPSPRGRGQGSGHWKQNTINGNPSRGTGILNNELYIGRRIWNRQRSSKHPETGKRVFRPNPADEWEIHDAPDLRIIEQDLWDAVKERQDVHAASRRANASNDKNGLSVSQSLRRRKYLLSGLLSCGQCGGNLTVAGGGKTRRYYCANAKEKGASVCTGMPGLKESDAAKSILSGLQVGLLQKDAFEDFQKRYLAKMKSQDKERRQLAKLRDKSIGQLEGKIANMIDFIGSGNAPKPLMERLEALTSELDQVQALRGSSPPANTVLPDDLPALYRGYVSDLVATLSDEGVAGRASDELHNLIDTVIVDWNADEKAHQLELRGVLSQMLNATKPAGEAGVYVDESSLKLVAGGGFGLWRTYLTTA